MNQLEQSMAIIDAVTTPKQWEVWTVYKSFPELHNVYDNKGDAEEVAAELRRERDLDDAYVEEA
jgi:hypothetical protein